MADSNGWSRVKALLEVAKLVLPLVGLGIYGFSRVAHDSFADAFGLTTEELGVTYSDILSRAAVSFSIYVSLGILMVGLVLTGILILPERAISEAPERGWKKPAERLFVTVAPIVGGFIPLILALAAPSIPEKVLNLPEWGLGLWLFWGLLTLLILIAPALIAWAILGRLESILERVEDMRGLISAVVLILTLLTIVCFVLAAERGDELASAVVKGKIPSVHEFELVGVDVVPVCLVSKVKELVRTHPYFLLGSNETRFILFDPQEKLVIRIPSAGVALKHVASPRTASQTQEIGQLSCD